MYAHWLGWFSSCHVQGSWYCVITRAEAVPQAQDNDNDSHVYTPLPALRPLLEWGAISSQRAITPIQAWYALTGRLAQGVSNQLLHCPHRPYRRRREDILMMNLHSAGGQPKYRKDLLNVDIE